MIAQLILKRFLVPSIAALALGACDQAGPVDPQVVQSAVAANASHAQQLPFHGNTVGRLVGQVFPAPAGRCPPTRPILASYEGAGTATHLGRFTVVGSECMFFDPSNPTTAHSGEGRWRFTAANGDWLDVAYDNTTLQFEAPPSPWLRWSAAAYVVAGGGRFEGAEFIDVTWAGGFNLVTQETYSNIDGQIVYDASDRAR